MKALSTHLKKKEERLQQVLGWLAEESSKGTPTIVEGQKDIRALRTLNVDGPITAAKSGGKTLLDLVSELENQRPKEVILLLDFDRRGREWTGRLKRHLESAKIIPNTTFWCKLLGLVGREIKDVESLAAYVETLEKKAGNQKNTITL